MNTMKKIICVILLIYGGVFIMAQDIQEAYFAGGCFWSMEIPFEETAGVQEVFAGFAGGIEKNPKYKDVSKGKTVHREAIKVIYDADMIDYDTLLNIFWRQINPTDNGGQFADRGAHYTTAIFYKNESEQTLAQASKERLGKSEWFDNPIVTPIIQFSTFYPAQKYHQNYYKKNPTRYNYYKKRSRKIGFLEKTWKEESNDIDTIPLKKP